MAELHFKTFGEGQPVIFLHGLFGMLDNWQTFAKKVADAGYMVYLIDQRDHGKSPYTEDFSYPVLSQDLYDFMTAHWLHKAIIVGHSMGGKTALQFAVDHDDMIDKLVIVDIGIKAYKGGHEAIFEALRSIDLSAVEDRNIVADHLKSALPNDDEDTIQFLLKNLQRDTIHGGFRWKMNVDLLYHKYENILAPISFDQQVDVETLFVRGGESNYIKDEDWREISQQFPNSSLQTIEGAGHWVHAQKPNELFDAIRAFI